MYYDSMEMSIAHEHIKHDNDDDDDGNIRHDDGNISHGFSFRTICGPLMVGSAVCLSVVPYILSSWHCAISTFVFLCGVLLCLHDVGDWCLESTRSYMRRSIEGVSLDELLQSVHNAELAVVGNFVGSFVGQIAMYGLPCSKDQRVRLFQSGFDVPDAREARRMLLEPGGWSALLPESAQNWIFEPPSKGKITYQFVDEGKGLSSPDPETNSHDSTRSSDVSDLYELEKDRIRSKTFVDDVSALIGVKVEHVDEEPCVSESCDVRTGGPEGYDSASVETKANPPPPIHVFGSVLKEMILETVSHHMNLFSQNNTLEIAGATTSALLLGRLFMSRRTRRMIMGLFGGLTTVGIATVWSLSMISLSAKHYDRLRALRTNPASLSSIGLILKRIVAQATDPKIQGLLAALVMLYWRRPRRRDNISSKP